MIDLSAPLPSVFIVEGKEYKINTDFRIWLKVEQTLKSSPPLWYLASLIFEDGTPNADFTEPMKEFLASPNATPKVSGEGAGERIIDHFLDGEYIYGSVLHYYGIDLVDIEYLHWHKFKAMINCLGGDTKMSNIMDYRSYTKPPDKQKPEQVYQKLKSAWKLPDDDQDKEAFLEEAATMFYNT